ncbi:MAG: hypothetical protein NVSMB14_10860 [Isosphaeraceae bacterium]
METIVRPEQATLTDFIRRDLTARIRTFGVAPAPLTLPSLSKHYGVSLTPVRIAVRDLIEDGLLLKRENGRLAVNSKRVRSSRSRRPFTPIGEPPKRAEQLERALALEIISKSLRGEADYLREETAAHKHGVGRTAIRQAYDRLAGQGLIVHEPRKGRRVRVFDQCELDSYLEVREVLELKALDLARPRLVLNDLRRMLDANRPNDRPPKLDNSLHRYWIDKSENSYIVEFFDRHSPYYAALLDLAAPATREVAAMAQQHRAILLELIAGDHHAACDALSAHIRAQRPIVQRFMTRLNGDPFESKPELHPDSFDNETNDPILGESGEAR